MSSKLFHLRGSDVVELPASRFTIEKQLQTLLESHLEPFLGVRFLASEYSTGAKYAGRIDTLGLDENNVPVIIEYKREMHESVINQGLFYLDWLVNNRAEFQLLVQDRLGMDTAKAIDWTGPRLICIAGEFTRYDSYAVQQIPRNIELIRYRRYGDEHLMLEQVNTPLTLPARRAPEVTRGPVMPPAVPGTPDPDPVDPPVGPAPVELALQKCAPDVQARHQLLHDFVFSLGDDIQLKTLKLYFAYRRLKNFVCIIPGPAKGDLWLYLRLDPTTVVLENGFTRDVRSIGHWATGDLEVTIKNDADVEKVKALIQRAYEQS